MPTLPSGGMRKKVLLNGKWQCLHHAMPQCLGRIVRLAENGRDGFAYLDGTLLFAVIPSLPEGLAATWSYADLTVLDVLRRVDALKAGLASFDDVFDIVQCFFFRLTLWDSDLLENPFQIGSGLVGRSLAIAQSAPSTSMVVRRVDDHRHPKENLRSPQVKLPI